jgi:hypothetical protein
MQRKSLSVIFTLLLITYFLSLPAAPSLSAQTGLTINNISDNRANYPNSQIPKYAKFEITFQIQNTTARNFQFPYDSSPPAGIITSSPSYDGINVDAVFIDPQGRQFRQPAFYYQNFQENLSQNWLYPTTGFSWKVRFAPNTTGNWQYKLIATDKSGTVDSSNSSGWASFSVASSAGKGFIRVSRDDPRYFEFENGEFFPSLGYNENYRGIDWVNFYTSNKSKLETMGQNGIQFTRIWLSQWPLFGSGWTPWRPYEGNGYLVANNLSYQVTHPEHELSMRIAMYPNSSGGYSGNKCMQWGWETYLLPTVSGRQYTFKVRYKISNQESPTSPLIQGPRISGYPYGLAVKLAGWLPDCYEPGNGTVIAADYNTSDIGTVTSDIDGWNILSNTYTASSSTLPRIHLALENVTESRIYIDQVEIIDSVTGVNIMTKPTMDHHLSFDQRSATAFDKTLELAEANGVYLRPVLLEKNDWIFNRLSPTTGSFTITGDSNIYFYGEFRNMTKTRWLQKALWRYAQARWGYSTAIHSWELLNEGDPDIYSTQLTKVGRHQMLTDELGKYMHCEVFGIPAGTTNSKHQCPTNFNHPNTHMTTTSHWHSFPWHFWANKHSKFIEEGNHDWSFFNVDYATVHRYINSSDPLFYDAGLMTYTHGNEYGKEPTSSSSVGKAVMRGETAFGEETSTIRSDTTGTWLHNFIWAQLNHSGMYDASYWEPAYKHIYSSTHDFRDRFKPFYAFIKDIPLNRGGYRNANPSVSNTNIRTWGQINPTGNKAHVWVQNNKNTWKNIVDNVTISPQSATITISGFSPNISLTVQRWDTYLGTVISSQNQTTSSQGILSLSVSNLTTDTAFKIGNYTTTPTNSPTPQPTASSTPTLKPGDANGDGRVDGLDYVIWLNNYGRTDATGPTQGDFNSDSRVDGLDYVVWLNNYGT